MRPSLNAKLLLLCAAIFLGAAPSVSVAGRDSASVSARMAAAQDGSHPQPLGVPGTWSLAFDDEFQGRTVDHRLWARNWFGATERSVTHSDNRRDENCVDPAQAGEDSGSLALAAVSRPCVAAGVRHPYASGLISTRRTFAFTYGYMEARIYIPSSSSGSPVNFPAFWATSTDPRPGAGEIDIMEVLGSCGPGLGYHFHSRAGSSGACVPMATPSGWHTFGADWQPGSVSYFYDGQPVGRASTGVTGTPMYLVLNNSVDPTYGGIDDGQAVMRVDYVRVWR